MDKLTFGQALDKAINEQKCIAREGWNGKGLFVFYRPTDMVPRRFVEKGIANYPPDATKLILDRTPVVSGPTKIGDEAYVPFTGHFIMFAADKTVVNGWLASQTDMSAADWVVVEPRA